MDKAAGVDTVHVKNIGQSTTAICHCATIRQIPLPTPQGYVKLPNVNSFIEMMDMREAERSYSANLSVMQATRSMLNKTIDLLK